jgi:hypothetical protein
MEFFFSSFYCILSVVKKQPKEKFVLAGCSSFFISICTAVEQYKGLPKL